MKSNTVRTGKRIMAVMLSLMMVAGIFAGMKLDVRAANTYTAGKDLIQGQSVKEKDKIVVPGPKSGKHGVVVVISDPSGTGHYWQSMCSGDTSQQLEGFVPPSTWENKQYNNYVVEKCCYEEVPGNLKSMRWIIILKAVDEVSGNESQSGVRVVEIPSHTCNFQWTTTIDPTTGADGLEEYKCVYCGAVQESYSIPAGVAVVKDFYGKVKDAPANGTVTYDSGKLYTISDYLLKKMSERNDVTLTVNFEYQNAKYELTFPAGTDFTPVLADEETMYGYFGVAAKLGLTVAAK